MTARRINITMQREVEERAQKIMKARVIKGLSPLLATLVVEEYERRKLDPQIEERLRQVEAEIRESMRRNQKSPQPSGGAPAKPHIPSSGAPRRADRARGRRIPSARGKHPTEANNG